MKRLSLFTFFSLLMLLPSCCWQKRSCCPLNRPCREVQTVAPCTTVVEQTNGIETAEPAIIAEESQAQEEPGVIHAADISPTGQITKPSVNKESLEEAEEGGENTELATAPLKEKAALTPAAPAPVVAAEAKEVPALETKPTEEVAIIEESVTEVPAVEAPTKAAATPAKAAVAKKEAPSAAKENASVKEEPSDKKDAAEEEAVSSTDDTELLDEEPSEDESMADKEDDEQSF